MRKRLHFGIFLCILPLVGVVGLADARSSPSRSCEAVVSEMNQSLTPKIDEKELVMILRTLNQTRNRKLPPKFITKSHARRMGWKPGRDLWASDELAGKSLGWDVFSNREGRLPDGRRMWREADLDYKGGHRGPKRLIYSEDGLRGITVDHYKTFQTVPSCE